MVSVCLPSDTLLPHLPSYLGFCYLGLEVSLHGCSSKAQPLLLTVDKVAPPDLEHGVAPLGPPAPAQPPFLEWVMVERSDRMWSTEEGNGKPLQYSSLENPKNSMKRQKEICYWRRVEK